MSDKKKKGRNTVDMNHLMADLTSRVKQIDYWKKDNTDSLPAAPNTHQIARPAASAHAPSVKEKQYKRAATHVCNQLYNSKSKSKDSKFALTTYHRYLTRIKNNIRKNIARHNPELPEIMAELMARYPQYSDLLSLMVGDKDKYVNKVKAHILSKLSQVDKVDADELHAEISDLSKNGKIEHPVIKYLALTEAQQQRRKNDIAARLKERKSNKQSYNLGFISRVTDECLDSDNFNELAIGIALATGRRAIEVIYRGNFAVEGSHKIKFSGQAKKGKGVKAEAYTIPTLKSAEKIVEAVEKLRATDKYKELESIISSLPDEERNTQVNTRCARMLNYTVKNLLSPSTKHDDSPVKFKDCRAIALQSAILKIMPLPEYAKLDINEFVLRFQGHDDYEEFANYQDIAVADAPEPAPKVEPVAPVKPVGANVAALEGIDDVINAMGKKTLYKLHERVKEWAVRTGAKVEQTPLYKGAKGDKVGGSLALIKTYLTIPEIAEAVEAYNAGKEDA